MKIVNLTPHPITLRTRAGEDLVVPPDGRLARVSSTPGQLLCGMPDDCPVDCYTSPVWGNVYGLPEPEEGTIYLVSALVLGRVSRRFDVFAPGTGPNDGTVRDEAGKILAVTRLVRCECPALS